MAKKTDNRGWTALTHGVVAGHLSVVRILLQNGFDPLLPDNDGHDALWHATELGHSAIVEILTEYTTVQNRAIRATLDGDAQLLVNLIAQDPTVVNYRDASGLTPLKAAAQKGHPDCLALLIDAGADMNLM
jgi:cytohesin